jgi:hypothetical protein
VLPARSVRVNDISQCELSIVVRTPRIPISLETCPLTEGEWMPGEQT